MDEDRTSWPLIVGITAGILGAVTAVVFLHSMKSHDSTDVKLRNAQDIIAQCRNQIKEIESSLDILKQPSAV